MEQQACRPYCPATFGVVLSDAVEFKLFSGYRLLENQYTESLFDDLTKLGNTSQCGCGLALRLHQLVSQYAADISADRDRRVIWFRRLLGVLEQVVYDLDVLMSAGATHDMILKLQEKYDWKADLSAMKIQHEQLEIVELGFEDWLIQKGLDGGWTLLELDYQDAWLDRLYQAIRPPRSSWVPSCN